MSTHNDPNPFGAIYLIAFFSCTQKPLCLPSQKGDFTLTEITRDEVKADELLVEMKYYGLCHTVGDPIFRNLRKSTFFQVMIVPQGRPRTRSPERWNSPPTRITGPEQVHSIARAATVLLS